MDRPRRALIEDPADESGENNGYVPRRSGGFAPPEPEPRTRGVGSRSEPDQSPIARGARSAPGGPTHHPGARRAGGAPVPDSQPLRVPPRHRLHSRHRIDPIVVDRLIKSYGGAVAVRNLSFTVEPGRVTGFLGRTVLARRPRLRILVGLARRTVGTATFGPAAVRRTVPPAADRRLVLEASFHPGRSGRNHLRVLAPTAGARTVGSRSCSRSSGSPTIAPRPAGSFRRECGSGWPSPPPCSATPTI